jgi:hypothetical protein
MGTKEQLTVCRLCSFSFTSFSRARASSIAETTREPQVKTQEDTRKQPSIFSIHRKELKQQIGEIQEFEQLASTLFLIVSFLLVHLNIFEIRPFQKSKHNINET